MSAEERGTIEARLEWWRRASLGLVGVIALGVAAWFGVLSGQVQDNRDSIDGLHSEIASLRVLVSATAQAQRDTTSQLAMLTGQLEMLVQLDLLQERQE